MTAFLIVRAEVDPSVKDAFDAWYQHEHLPEAVEAFGATSAWRGWSSVNDNVPMAFYEFMEPADVNRVMGSDALKRMVGELDRHWQDKVTRTSEVVESVQAI